VAVSIPLSWSLSTAHLVIEVEASATLMRALAL